MLSRAPAVAAIVLLTCIEGGCAAVRETKAMRVERTLAASGFQIKLAKTPEQMQEIEKLPQRKLVRARFENDVRYVYGDTEYCKCLYAGTERAFQRYRVAAAEQIQEQALASSMLLNPPIDAATLERNETLATRAILDPSMEPSIDWSLWGPWDPWY